MTDLSELKTKDLVERLDELPTLPAIVYELSGIINDPMSSTADVEKIMANDQSLTTKVLKLVNSAYYAIPGGVSNLARAIAYIGFDSVHQLVLASSILEALQVKGPTRFDLNEFWKHSMGVAVAAESIAVWVRHPMPSDVFTCGLVHDMGKVALYSLEAEAIIQISNYAKESEISFWEAEEALDTVRHTEIGFHLAKRWRLPSPMQNAIKYHHQKDPRKRGGISADLNQIVDIVYLANLFTHALKFGDSGHRKVHGAPKDVMERLTISPEGDFKNILQEIKKNLEKASGLIKAIGG